MCKRKSWMSKVWLTCPSPTQLLGHFSAGIGTQEIHSPPVICLFFQETHSELISSRASASPVGSAALCLPQPLAAPGRGIQGPFPDSSDAAPPGTSRPQMACVLTSWALGRGLSLL